MAKVGRPRQEQCKQGHSLLDPKNVYITSNGYPVCRACRAKARKIIRQADKPPERHVVQTHDIYQENNKWFVFAETPQIAVEMGPFDSEEEAEDAVDTVPLLPGSRLNRLPSIFVDRHSESD